MADIKKITEMLKTAVQRLRDTKYATCDIEERLVLARMEVANLRAALLDVKNKADAELCAAKLKCAEEEYRRILRISRGRRAM